MNTKEVKKNYLLFCAVFFVPTFDRIFVFETSENNGFDVVRRAVRVVIFGGNIKLQTKPVICSRNRLRFGFEDAFERYFRFHFRGFYFEREIRRVFNALIADRNRAVTARFDLPEDGNRAAEREAKYGNCKKSSQIVFHRKLPSVKLFIFYSL